MRTQILGGCAGWLLLAASLAAAEPPERALPLHAARSAATDLAVSGLEVDGADGATRYVSWRDLRALPVTPLRVRGAFGPGEEELTVLFLADLWRALPGPAGADVLLAACRDGYASVFPAAFIGRYRPFLVLEIDGRGPDRWPPPGISSDPGPYAILIASEVVPGANEILDASHKKPWGVTTLEFAREADRFRGIFSGPWAALSARAREGRSLWMNSCASCHSGPAGAFGGVKSGQAFLALQSLAELHPTAFAAYVRNPRAVVPNAAMPARRYTDAQLAALIAFVTAEQR